MLFIDFHIPYLANRNFVVWAVFNHPKHYGKNDDSVGQRIQFRSLSIEAQLLTQYFLHYPLTAFQVASPLIDVKFLDKLFLVRLSEN